MLRFIALSAVVAAALISLPGCEDKSTQGQQDFQADMDKDGKRELIIKKNTPGGLGRSADVPASFKTGEIISLSCWARE